MCTFIKLSIFSKHLNTNNYKKESMKGKDLVYREMLYGAMEKKTTRFTQLDLAKKLGVSLSTVNNALKPLSRMGAVEVGRMGFRLIDTEKALLYWASARNLDRDIIYSTNVATDVKRMEGSMPSGVIFTCYTGYRLKFKDVPADYSEVLVYADEEALEEMKRRFPAKKGPPTLIVLKGDGRLKEISKDGVAPTAQIFVDLWNLREWHAKEFVNALLKRTGG